MPRFCTGKGEWQDLAITAHPFGKANKTNSAGVSVADYRIVGVLDMATAIRRNRPHRASGDLALHTLEILEALEQSAVEGRTIPLQTRCTRPEPLPLGEGEEVFAT